MASKTVNGSKGHHKFTVTIAENSSSISIANNTSSVSWTVTLAPIQNGYDWLFNYNDPFTLTLTVDGSTYTYTLRNYDGSSTVNIGSGSKTITHSTNGSKSITWSFSFADNPDYSSYTFLPGSGSSGNQTLVLTTIPRYGTSVQSLKSKTETSITMNWSSDNTVDYIWYSSNGGSSWTGVNVTDGTSGSYTISGLSANTSYSIKTRIRRKDSQLTTDSSALSVTTYAYPYANSMPNFNIGNSVTIGVYNPLGRTFTITLIATNNSEQTASSSYSGTSVSGWKADSTINFLYASIPSATSGTYKVRITYGSHSETRTGGTYYAVKANVLPTAGTLTYADTKTAITTITENSSKIVQGKSIVRYTVSGVAGNKSATISSVKVAVNGNTYTLSKSGNNYVGGNAVINSSSNVTATVTVTDSRGYTSTTSKTVTMLAYSSPSVKVSHQRQGGYYDSTTLTIDITLASLDGKNAIYGTLTNNIPSGLVCRYRKKGTTSWSTATLSRQTANKKYTATHDLDNTSEWEVNVSVTDKVQNANSESATVITYIVSRGLPIMFFDTLRNSVGVGVFPIQSNSFELGKARIRMQYNGQTTFFMHRTDRDTQAGFYLWDSTNPGLQLQYKQAGDTEWSFGALFAKNLIRCRENNAMDLGAAAYNWKNIYGTTIYENGVALSTKYGTHFKKLNSDGGWTDNATVATATWTTAGSFEVDAGPCLVLAYAQFQNNSTGARLMLIAGGSDSTSRYTYMAHDYRNAYAGGNITGLRAIFVTNESSARTLYCRVYQNSGSALQCLSRFTVFRLGNAV